MPSNDLGSYDGFSFRPSIEAKRSFEKMMSRTVSGQMRASLAGSTTAVLPALRAAARSISSQSKYARGGLRQSLAKSVRRVIVGVRNSVTVSIMAGDKGGLSNLARAVEGEIPWTHPVFGNQGTTVNEKAKPWFYRTLEGLLPSMDRVFLEITNQYDRTL